MKLSKIFTKKRVAVKRPSLTVVEKKQLEKVIGGTGESKAVKGGASDGLSA